MKSLASIGRVSQAAIQSKPVAYFSQDFVWEDWKSEVEASEAKTHALDDQLSAKPGDQSKVLSEISREQCHASLSDGVEGSQDASSGANKARSGGTAHGALAWEGFHTRHMSAHFFKERRYLLEEFPELKTGPLKILEVGCGSGSTTVPLLSQNLQTLVYACDCSPAAVAHTSAAVQKALGLVVATERFRGFCWDAATEPFPLAVLSENVPSGLGSGSICLVGGSEGGLEGRLDSSEGGVLNGKCKGFRPSSALGSSTLGSVAGERGDAFVASGHEGLESRRGDCKSGDQSEEGESEHVFLGPGVDTGKRMESKEGQGERAGVSLGRDTDGGWQGREGQGEPAGVSLNGDTGTGLQGEEGEEECAGVNVRRNTSGVLESRGSGGLQRIQSGEEWVLRPAGGGLEAGRHELETGGSGIQPEKLESQLEAESEETAGNSEQSLCGSWEGGSGRRAERKRCTVSKAGTGANSCIIASPACVSGRVHSECSLEDQAEDADNPLTAGGGLESFPGQAGRTRVRDSMPGRGLGDLEGAVEERGVATKGGAPEGRGVQLGNGLGDGFNFVTLIFTLSAVHPTHMASVLRKLRQQLRPGGAILFRDYGLYDMTMLRFPPGQKVGERLYRRLDGTLSYFFSKEALCQLAGQAGFVVVDCEYCCVALTNKRKKVEMKRVWLHARLQKQS